MINPVRLAIARRPSLYKDGKVLLANFSKTKQKHDIEKSRGTVNYTIEDFFRVKTNVKTDELDAYYKTLNKRLLKFDFNWWPLPYLNGKMEDYNEVFIYQLKGCNARCKFCFVDNFNINGKYNDGAQYFSVEEIVDSFIHEREHFKALGKELNVLRPSGGEPTLAIEHWLSLLQELDKRGLSNEVYVQSDTNLLTGHVLDYLVESTELNNNLLDQVSEFNNFGLLACFKGTDPENFSQNTGCKPEFFEHQFYSFKKLVDKKLAVYPHLVNPNPKTLEQFMQKLAGMITPEVYSLVHILKLGAYGPVMKRLNNEALKFNDKNYAEKVTKSWQKNLEQCEEIMDSLTMKMFKVGYKQASRHLIVKRLFKQI